MKTFGAFKICSAVIFGILFLGMSIDCFGATLSAIDDGSDAKPKKVITSLTIYPVKMAGQTHTKIAEVLGVIFEKDGFRKVTISDTSFTTNADASFEKIVESFSAFIKKSKITTEYALFGEYLGGPKEGVKGIRGVVVDKKGNVAWKEYLKHDAPEFKRANPKCPMTCTVFLSERISPSLVKSGISSDEPGPLELLWAKRSGIPEKKERDAIKLRLQEMKKTIKGKKIVVYPVRLGDKVDSKGAERICELINNMNSLKATISEQAPCFNIKPNSNEQKVLWDMAKAFQTHVRKNRPKSDYVLYADFMVSKRSNKAMAVHFVVCDNKGDFVIVDYQNSHHKDFQKVAPKTCLDCSELAARRIEGYLK